MGNIVRKNRYLVGTNGDVWFDGKRLASLEKAEIKVTLEWEETKPTGTFATYYVFVGWSGEGTLSLKKIDSQIVSRMIDMIKTGVEPEIKIVTKLTNPSTKKSERTVVSQVCIKEFSLANFESHGLVAEDIPFTFSDVDNLELILYEG